MVTRSDGEERRHKRHSEVLTGDRLQPLATVATRPPELPGTELLAQKFKSWGVPPDDLTVNAVRRRMARIQLSIEDQYWLLETAEHIAAAEKAFGLKGLTELAKYKNQLTDLVEPYTPQLTYISAHESALEQLEKGSAQAPHQWQHWFFVDLAGMVVFIPLIWLTKGRWKPSSARRDAADHEAAVAEELARLIGEQPISV